MDGMQIEIPVELKTEAKNGVPHGMCMMSYMLDFNPTMNFTGFGFMENGKLQGSAIFFTQDTRVYAYEKMLNGKPHGPGCTYLGL